MKYKLKVYTIWEFGQRVDAEGNPHQEDCTFPQPEDIKDTDRLFILCDGMGGHDAGEIASTTVCEAMADSVLKAQPDAEGDFTDSMFQQALLDAFEALDSKDTGAAKKMGTTMTFLKLHSRGCTIAHMGDSRVYHIRPGKNASDTRILFQTKDHSLVNDLIAIGELTEEEAKNSRQKNVITRAMQPHMEHRPKADVYHSADIRPDDYFYLCSDGMLENMENPQICYNFSEAAGTDEEKVHRLTQATSENRDNHTAIIVHIMEVMDPIEEKKPTPAKAPSAPTPIMAEVHDDDEEEMQEPTQEKEAVAEEKKPMPTSSSAPLPPAKPKRKSRAFLYFIIALIAAFAIAFFVVYFLVLNKEGEKGETDTREQVQTEERADNHIEETKPQNAPMKTDSGKEPETTAPVKPQPEAEEEAGQASVPAPIPETSALSEEETNNEEEEDGVVESDQEKIEKITEENNKQN